MDQNLYNLIKKYNPSTFLDIGANEGAYAESIKNNFPHIQIFSIEANSECEASLKSKNLNYIIACPSDKKDIKTFYKTKIHSTNTGNSLYKENTEYYSDKNLIIEQIQTDTLDNILSEYKNISFDFMKLDTQGSELDILKGATGVLNKVHIIICETDTGNYNENCPKQEDIINYLTDKGFKCLGSVENHYLQERLIQQDLVFEKQK